MLVAKYFLTVIAILYGYLAIWCCVSPAITSSKVGLERIEDTGRSEFMTVYGGLEMGLALVFLVPWLGSQYTSAAVLACALVHGCLVLFRSLSFWFYPKVATMTIQLAAGEWLIFLLSLAAFWLINRSTVAS
jgi:hypothetical protein